MKTELFQMENGVRLFSMPAILKVLQARGKEKFGENFRLYREDQQLLYLLAIYFIHDQEACAKNNLDLRKGICLTGPIGAGKTSLMILFNGWIFQEDSFQLMSTRDVAGQFNQQGFEVVYDLGKRGKPICLDDLGVEIIPKHYGTECNTIAEVLMYRYDLFQNHRILTHATTNLNAEELEKKYGNRVRSRLRAMFNLISFSPASPDKRK
ncbi:MAG: ATPase [Crocinitomicaceae bacterium]|jgi:DNA replication protein DnaC|nr:ATPase [Crocinitomicaceae bacterium]